MKHLKIIRIGIFASMLGLLGCGHGNKRATQSESINPYIPVAAQITMDKLSGVLKNVQAGRTEYDLRVSVPMAWIVSISCRITESSTLILKP